MKKIKIKENLTIRQAMKKLSQSGAKCLVIIDEKNNLLGTLSDGDLRKAILNGSNMGDSIKNIYQLNPTVLLNEEYVIEDAKKLFTNNKFDLIPIVDNKGKLVDVLQWESVFKNGESERNSKLDAPVVIMAGGKGTRLEPFTNILPKPLIPIHEKPVIEHIIECFTQVGVKDFILSVNYKSRIMKAFFDEINPTYNINFIEEEKPLGTAGSLLSLKNQYNKPLLVTNCDIIVKTDYYDLYKFHQKNNYD